ncbi:PREDICTED: protein LATERAL ROOT PRIMORDIUM 1 [Ipomoea nil]|uniref:protein LATERAL ROOT PRIMORDIUM 1 n=1 Tax=Ipomoea nil TaxID=35883 RepID=UPI0009010B48|nr:PREDICTED: protein LATERAL ROOT PRIMORDIUM 1 [Ipomoea nil]
MEDVPCQILQRGKERTKPSKGCSDSWFRSVGILTKSAVVATGRRVVLPSSDSNFSDWAVASSSATHSSAAAAFGDLSLGFNAAPNSAVDGGAASAAAGHVGVWSSSSARQMQQQINHGVPPDMGMFVVAPAASFLHHHNQNHPACISFDGSSPAATALGVGVGVNVIPLLADDLVVNSSHRGRGGGGLQLWQSQDAAAAAVAAAAGQNSSSTSAAADISYTKKPGEHPHGSPSSNSQSFFQLQGGGGGAGGATASTCQDCGNQAKKDCVHRRCRTCCKSRGLDCTTHVKSTWVPAARRRERQQGSHPSSPAAVTASCSQSVSSGSKKPRLVLGNNSQTSTSNNTATTPRSFDTGDSGGGGGSMPKQVTAPAEFRCVRVSPVDGGEDDEFAYQAVVRIGGHVFKGFLYDQGLDNDGDDHAGNNPHHPGLFPNISDLNLGARGASNNVILGSGHGTTSSPPPPPPILAASSSEPHDIFGMGGGSNFGIGNPF